MEPDAQIEAWAAQAGIHVLFGSERLVELAADARVYFPPTAEEVELVMPEEPVPASPADPTAAAVDLHARQVVIQCAEVVNVYTTAVE